MTQSNNKTIIKNTSFLYFRMMFTMIISLYTSRVILQTLGVEDYGIYQAVGGIVGFLSFINSALSTGSSRFLTFELGKGNLENLRKTFSTTLTIHIILALFIILIAEFVGIWFIETKMNIPPDRINAALYTFHLSILTAFFTLTQVPYNASIIAHEHMSVYAYVSIVEVTLKLLIIYLLMIGNVDKLVLYATLLLIVQVGLMLYYRYYCYKHFVETKFKLSLDKKIFKEIASFSGWSLFANASIALNNQGILLLLNMFFSPAVVAARAISIQVNMAANQFVDNFRTAVNPQIVKKFASEDYEGSKQLLLSSTKYSYFMMWILGLPIYLSANHILHIWLNEVPEYTTIFLQLIIIQSLFQVFDTSFYTALYAIGRLKENALISPTLGFIRFPIVYILFKMGYSPVALSWASLVTYALLATIIKPTLIIKIAGYSWKDIWNVYKPCIMVTLVSIPIPLFIHYEINNTNMNIYEKFILTTLVSIICIAISTWKIGLEKNIRDKIYILIIKKIREKLK